MDSGQKGFSLLEILVAFSILAISMGVLLRVFAGGVKLADISDGYVQATLLAESQLAETTAGELEAGETEGEFDDNKYRWTVSIEPYAPEFAEVDLESLAYEPHQVIVKVSWGEGSFARTYQLSTLRLLPKTSF